VGKYEIHDVALEVKPPRCKVEREPVATCHCGRGIFDSCNHVAALVDAAGFPQPKRPLCCVGWKYGDHSAEHMPPVMVG
jgi:hypothetical protein